MEREREEGKVGGSEGGTDTWRAQARVNSTARRRLRPNTSHHYTLCTYIHTHDYIHAHNTYMQRTQYLSIRLQITTHLQAFQ